MWYANHIWKDSWYMLTLLTVYILCHSSRHLTLQYMQINYFVHFMYVRMSGLLNLHTAIAYINPTQPSTQIKYKNLMYFVYKNVLSVTHRKSDKCFKLSAWDYLIFIAIKALVVKLNYWTMDALNSASMSESL
jgi:hypothetical protein